MSKFQQIFTIPFRRSLFLALLIHLIVFNVFVYSLPTLKSISNPVFLYYGDSSSLGFSGDDPVSVFEKFKIHDMGQVTLPLPNNKQILLEKPFGEIRFKNSKQTSKTLFSVDENLSDENFVSPIEIKKESPYKPLRLPGDDNH